MRRYLFVAIFLAATLYPSRASAALVTYLFEGTVTQTDAVLPVYMPGIDVSDPFSLFITFDDALIVQDPMMAFLNRTPYEMFVGDFRIWGPTIVAPNLDTLSWFVGPHINVDGPWARVPIFPGDFLQMSEGELTFFSLDFIACPPGTLGTCDDTPGFIGTVDTARLVPDAGGTALLLAFALCALAVVRQVV